MLESELFGHKKGAFTGAESEKMGLLEIADRGTFFVDEVGDMGLSMQAKLLRALETGVFRKLGDTKEKKVDVRFVFATNKELTQAVEQEKFRKDLYFRINTFVINLPPLREKREDIPPLVNYCLDKFSRAGRRKRISQNAMELLMAYDWPGNVRELQHVLERAVILEQRARRDRYRRPLRRRFKPGFALGGTRRAPRTGQGAHPCRDGSRLHTKGLELSRRQQEQGRSPPGNKP